MASVQQDIIEMPALGRKDFTVGSLYDCRTEILSGIYLFLFAISCLNSRQSWCVKMF